MIILSEHAAARLGIGGTKPRQKRGRSTRPDIPSVGRAERGDGDRVPDLMKLATAGWTCTHSDGAQHWMTGAAGVSDRYPTYRAMLDNVLKGTN